jgi:hypothetical protein
MRELRWHRAGDGNYVAHDRNSGRRYRLVLGYTSIQLGLGARKPRPSCWSVEVYVGGDEEWALVADEAHDNNAARLRDAKQLARLHAHYGSLERVQCDRCTGRPYRGETRQLDGRTLCGTCTMIVEAKLRHK